MNIVTKFFNGYITAAAVVLAFLASACSSRDEGDSLSMLQVEMCDLNTAQSKTATSCVLDDGTKLTFMSPLEVAWATTPDSTYRAQIYYNKVEGQTVVEAITARNVPCIPPVNAKDSKMSGYEDPVDFISAWLSKDKRYLNLCVGLKTGTADDKKAHKVGVVIDDVTSTPQGKCYHYRLCHSQEDIPTYYTIETYMSVRLPELSNGETVIIQIPTFKGYVTKEFTL